MPKTSRPSGNWGDNQKKDLRDLGDTNEIDLICNLPPFKPFISEASTGKNSAIQSMRKEFLRLNTELELGGARRKGMCVNSFPQR